MDENVLPRKICFPLWGFLHKYVLSKQRLCALQDAFLAVLFFMFTILNLLVPMYHPLVAGYAY